MFCNFSQSAHLTHAAFPDDEEPAKKSVSKQATKTCKAPSKSPVETSAEDDTAQQDDMDQAKLIAGLQKKNIAVSTAYSLLLLLVSSRAKLIHI